MYNITTKKLRFNFFFFLPISQDERLHLLALKLKLVCTPLCVHSQSDKIYNIENS